MGIYSCICKVSTTKMTSIMNPDVPFEMTFPHGNLHPGACIMIHGTSNHGANRFNINFEKLATQEHVFHFDFRFDQRETVRNTKFPSWGHEENLHYHFTTVAHSLWRSEFSLIVT